MDIQSSKNRIQKSFGSLYSQRRRYFSEIKGSSVSLFNKLPKLLHIKKLVFIILLFSVWTAILFYKDFKILDEYYTLAGPKFGGEYSEGILGQVDIINPIFASTSSANSDVSELVFSGLTSTNNKRQIIPDIASNWDISQDGKIYTFYLKDNIRWHDGSLLIADDIVFTVDSIQNPDTKSSLAPIWKGVKAEKLDDFTVRFTLPNAYAPFLTITDVGILPAHLLKEIPPKNLMTARFNLSPVGTGPYKFQSIEETRVGQEIKLVANEDYLPHVPNIKKIVLETYSDYQSLFEGYVKKEIDGISILTSKQLEGAKKLKDLKIYEIQLPRYFALFLNNKDEVLKDKNVRIALQEAIDKRKLVKDAVEGEALVSQGPIPPGYIGYKPQVKYGYSLEEANKLLEGNGWKLGEDGIGKKEDKELKFSFVTNDSSELSFVSEFIQKEWEKIGVKLDIIKVDNVTLQRDYIRPRNYDVLLFGENLGIDSDVYNYWHSTQINDPGLNLSLFTNQKADKYLEIARSNLDINLRIEKYEDFQRVISSEVPAIFLYNPTYFYAVKNNVSGINVDKIIEMPDRFNGVIDWYLEKKPVLKTPNIKIY